MFEQQQDTGESASLAEKYANAVALLSDSNDRAARAEHEIRRKDYPSGPTVQADCYEGLFWKSHATEELVAKMENAKYVLHQPFNRQIKKMAQDGFPMAAATMDDWHQAACGMIKMN